MFIFFASCRRKQNRNRRKRKRKRKAETESRRAGDLSDRFWSIPEGDLFVDTMVLRYFESGYYMYIYMYVCMYCHFLNYNAVYNMI